MTQKPSKKTPGRPFKPESERRSVTVHARLTPEEKAKLDHFLEEKGVSLSDIIVKGIDQDPK